MPLAAAIDGYKSQLNAAWTKAKNAGMNENANSDSIISNLAADIAAATKSYMESAQVVTNHIINPGQTAPGVLGLGIVSSPGSGVGQNGKLTFPTDTTLKSDIEAALRNARNSGKQDGASSDAIISSLALDLANAINKFALTGIVETDIQIFPGAFVIGYLSPPPVSSPVPGITGPGNGKGVGTLL